jgi:hypothetical protein
MLNPEELARIAAQIADAKCQCGHERKWHDSCSKCYCAGFYSGPLGTKEGKVWKAAMKLRETKEKD